MKSVLSSRQAAPITICSPRFVTVVTSRGQDTPLLGDNFYTATCHIVITFKSVKPDKNEGVPTVKRRIKLKIRLASKQF